MPAERTSPPRATRAPHKKFFVPSEPCEVCGKTVARAIDMTRHMRIHDPSKRMPCDFPGCDYSSVQKSNLETHRRRHFQNKEFKCKDDPATCKFETCDRSSLHRHRVRFHGYVPNETAPKNSSARGEGRRNPYRVPVRVIRTMNESGSSGAVLSQFSSFRSGSGSSSGASVHSTASTLVDSLSDLSDLSELSESENGSDSERSTPLSRSSSGSTCSSLSPIDGPSISAYPMMAPQYFLPQKTFGNFTDILSPSTSKFFTGANISQYPFQWSTNLGAEVKLEDVLPCDQYYGTKSCPPSDWPYLQQIPSAQTLDDIKYSPSACFQHTNGIPPPDLLPFQVDQKFQSGIPSHDYSVSELGTPDITAVFPEEQFNSMLFNFSSGANDPAYLANQVSQYINPFPDDISNALDTLDVAVQTNVFNYNQEEQGPGLNLEPFNDWNLFVERAQPHVSPSLF